MNELEKMINGKLYDSNDDLLVEKRIKAHRLVKMYNDSYENETIIRQKILEDLMLSVGKNVYLQGPIFCDYGKNITIGANTYANYNLTILDVCKVSIGENVFIGPNVSFLTPKHPLLFEERNSFFNHDHNRISTYEYGAPITVENNCWIAGNVTICPGVIIGEGSVIGAGSVVTKDIPKNSLAFGNPCKVIRKITDQDRLDLKKV